MLVQAGAFWMGRDDGGPDEAPMHRAYVADYWIERHKVTSAEFAAFLAAAGLTSPGGARRFDPGDADARIHRVGGRWTASSGTPPWISWFGARDYCAWRGRRLPTEAEWEKAAKGDDRRRYPWGSAPPGPELAVFGRPYNHTEAAHGRPGGAGPTGVEDLLGNLREWTSTALRPYPVGRTTGASRSGGRGRVAVRGASHDDPVTDLSVTRRLGYDRRGAAAGHHHIGFRCATSEDLGGR